MEAACAGVEEQLAEMGLEARDLLEDPTMAACCLEDLKNQRRAEALRQKLRDADRVEQRSQLRSGVLQQGQGHGGWAQGHGEARGVSAADGVPNTAEEQHRAGAGQAAENSLRSADAELEELRARRMQQMQREAQQASQSASKGYGQLNDVQASQLLERAEEVEGCCVCHLAVEGYEPSNVLDQSLEGLAHTHQGTLFLRALIPRRSGLKTALGLQGLPALVSFRGGALVGRAPLSQFGPPGDILEEEVTAYLRRLGVLRQPKGAAGPGPQGAGDSGTEDEGEEEEDEEDEGQGWRDQPPCEVCGRRYPHEHVKAVYTDRGPSDEDSDFD